MDSVLMGTTYKHISSHFLFTAVLSQIESADEFDKLLIFGQYQEWKPTLYVYGASIGAPWLLFWIVSVLSYMVCI